jgi:hypothetical protein
LSTKHPQFEKIAVKKHNKSIDLDIKVLNDKEFKEAVEKGDFVKMSQLKEQGYQPSKELIQSLNETASGNTMIAVQKIFNLKGSANTLGDVKLAQGQQSAEKDLKRPLANTVNKMFADL